MIEQLTVEKLKGQLDQKENLPVILDVREPWELDVCSMGGTHNIPMGQIQNRIDELNKDRGIVIMCHHGIRSQRVALFLQQQGFTNIYNLSGGIDAWAKQIDPQMAKY